MGNSVLCYALYALVLWPSVGTPVQHQVYAIASALMQLTYIRAHTSSPGVIDMGPNGRKAYENALQAAALGSLSDAASMRTPHAACRACHLPRTRADSACDISSHSGAVPHLPHRQAAPLKALHHP